MTLDRKGMVWGLLLSIIVTGLYDTLKFLMMGDAHQETITFIATILVAAIVFYTFKDTLLKED